MFDISSHPKFKSPFDLNGPSVKSDKPVSFDVASHPNIPTPFILNT